MRIKTLLLGVWCLAGGHAMASGETADELKALLWTLVSRFSAPVTDAERERCALELAGLSRQAGEPLPVDLCRFLLGTNKDDTRLPSLLLGFDPLGLEQVLWHYSNPNEPLSIFEPYRLKGSYVVEPGRDIVVGFSLERMHDGPEVRIDDVRGLVPVCQFQAGFIAYHLSKRRELNGLMVIAYGHLGSMLAPGFQQHFEDLLAGLEEGTYRVGADGGPVFPSSWVHRKGVRKGLLDMDRYGEVR